MALTAREQAFVDHYVAHRSGPDAYRAAYNVRATTSAKSIGEAASKLLATPKIQRAVDATIDATVTAGPGVASLTTMLERFALMATADRNELISLRVGCCRHCWGEDGGYQWREREYLARLDEVERHNLHAKPSAVQPIPDPAGGFGFRANRPPNPDCETCDGEGIERFVPRDTTKLTEAGKAIYGGVKVKANGAYEIVIADQAKAMENLVRMLGGYKDNVKLDGTINAMAAVVDMTKMDPQEASTMYQKLVADMAK